MDSEDNSDNIPWWDIIGHLETIVSNVKATASNIISSVSDFNSMVAGKFGELNEWMNNCFDNFAAWIHASFTDWFDTVFAHFTDIKVTIIGWFTSVGEWFVNLNNTISQMWDNFFAWIKLNFFTIDMDRVFETVDFKGKLEKKFGIFFEVGEALTGLKDKSVAAAAEPKIQVTLPAFLGGATVTVLDLTQFADIFAYGKMLLRGILWLGFAKWLLEYFSPKMSI